MIPLAFSAVSDASEPFVTRLRSGAIEDDRDSRKLNCDAFRSLWCGSQGLFEIEDGGTDLSDDVVLIHPDAGRADRLIRAGSKHNTLLVTERCDQLCVMCSQPPKKTHVDRFPLLEQACLIAPPEQTIGVSGGEPTLYTDALFGMLERVLEVRPDLSFHVLSNAQHFEREHVARLRNPLYFNVVWGIPLYSANPVIHDNVVGKLGAFERLLESFSWLLLAGARVELRTVLMRDTVAGLESLAHFVAMNLGHIEQWSLMGLENIGFARNRWAELAVDLRQDFGPIGSAIDITTLHGIGTKLFNVPLCHVPPGFRDFAVASISDWKQRFATKCDTCSARAACSGFFEWHPDALVEEVTPL